MAIVKLAEVASKLSKTCTAEEEENSRSSSWLYVLHKPWRKEISRSGLAVMYQSVQLRPSPPDNCGAFAHLRALSVTGVSICVTRVPGLCQPSFLKDWKNLCRFSLLVFIHDFMHFVLISLY